MSRQARSPIAAAALTALMLLSASPAGATQAGKRTAESAAKEADEAPRATAGQKAAVDGEGRLRPVTEEEARALTAGVARSVDQSGEGLTERQLPSGAVSLDLEDRFQSVSMARVAVDGSIATRCVTTVPEAERFLGAAARPAAAKAGTPGKATTTPAPLEEK